ncbi:hypothetical protein FSARC_13752 [Fusarium sarcochroum]|uniref:Mitochondrial dicarboxylate transporter n=1 Tax=Fusarium sarcochroum TaxID=1208366 RepID=A0A8H4WS85_9HYPO|nr:hypothetical protein FSARC_13752 [Fusarium sarcochroum]
METSIGHTRNSETAWANISTEIRRQTDTGNNIIKYPFWFGGSASALAACVTHPLDFGYIEAYIKFQVRIQTRISDAPRSFTTAVKTITQNEGFTALYNGISASIVRQLTYSSIRFGVYEECKYQAGPNPSGHVLLATAWCSGFIGGIAGNFADVLNVRMQHDGSLPIHQRKNYRHVGDGMMRMAREEGPAAFVRGWSPNCTRAAAQTAGQLASYDIIKKSILTYMEIEDTPAVQAASAFSAALVATTITNPLDVIKTRMMSTASGTGSGMLATARAAFRSEGAGWIIRGWFPSFLRVGPHTMCIFAFLEIHRELYRSMYV